jgi:hypothetical protein
MAKTPTEDLLQTGFEHLGRFAFYTRDNPFVSSRAALTVTPKLRQVLTELLDGELSSSDWLKSAGAQKLLGSIKVGSVPRDVQLVAHDGELVVGVESVHAFLQAELFWWMVSILWTITIASEIEPLLGDGVMGFRFHPAFLEDPATSGVMFRERHAAHARWEKFPSRIAAEHPDEILATNTLDISDFYYSIDVRPGKIISRFFDVKGLPVPKIRALRVLTTLLDALHLHFSERCAEVQPRRDQLGGEGMCPLPVGLPSSQVLANMVMSLVLGDLDAAPDTLASASYADDVIVMTRTLLDLDEKPADYFARLGLVSAEEPYPLKTPSTDGLAHLAMGLEKSGTSYSRHASNGEDDESAEEMIGGENWDPYIDSGDSPDWGGRLRTVLRAPHRRDRVPKELRREIMRLLDEIRVGLPPEEVKVRFDKLTEEMDAGLFVAIRPYWAELMVIGFISGGTTVVVELTGLLKRVCNSMKMPDGSADSGRDALVFGLRASWIQALAQALAVASDPIQQALLLEEAPELDVGGKPLDTKVLLRYARQIRARRLIPSELVAAPLAEFSAWKGRLIGGNSFNEFLEWSMRHYPAGDPGGLVQAVKGAARFIGLHEACLAIHLWAGSEEESWEEESFAVLGAQPLIRPDLVADLRARAKALLGEEEEVEEGEAEVDEGEENGGDPSYPLRIAMPSMRVSHDHLKALLKGDRDRLGEIVTTARSALQKVVLTAANGEVALLVLPEWAIPGQLLPWLMENASQNQMAIVGGGAPEIVGKHYRNQLWTGLPLTDKAGHRACLVPPPRQKKFLSPAEQKTISAADITVSPSSTPVNVFNWGEVRLASLICFEFADINVRQELRFRADVLTVSSLNRDWRYFESIQDATTRDDYCLTVCVNTGALPGTRIVRPTKSEMAVVAAVHGADRPAVITKVIDLRPILAAQANHLAPSEVLTTEPSDGVLLEDYKPFPPY